MAAHHLLLLFLFITLTLILLPFSATSLSDQNTGNHVPVGSSITATENSKPWLSPSGDFAFGFQQLQNNTNHDHLFILAIWFNKIPDKTIVWFERSSYPVPRGSTLRLDADAGLMLHDPQGKKLYNSNDGLAKEEVAYGFMNDTGNFVLTSQGNSTNSLWESFNHPADTILPTQTIEIKAGGMLISKKMQNDFSYGRFYAGMNAGGNFVLNTKSVYTNTNFDDEYYNSSPNSGDRVVFDESPHPISVAISSNGSQNSILISSNNLPSSEYYFRAALDFDGVFSLYYYPKNESDYSKSRWVAAGSLPNNICMSIDGDKGSGACGFNNVCWLVNSKPDCRCPEGFWLADPNNHYGDCKSNFTDKCGGGGGQLNDEYALVEISDVDWPFNDYEQMMPSSVDECRSACLSDYFCGAAIFRSGSCWKKRLPLSNGRVDTSLGAKAFLKVRK